MQEGITVTREMTSTQILDRLFIHFSAYDYCISNVYVYAWESDFFCLSKSGYAYEVEVKVSRQDFKADFKKEEKHNLLSSPKRFVTIPGSPRKFHVENGRLEKAPNCRVYIKNKNKDTPNRFYYAAPKGLLCVDDIPEYAGLVEVDSKIPYVQITKQAPFIHRHKNDLTKILLSKFYFAYMKLRNYKNIR